jgi:hypothetical protein
MPANTPKGYPYPLGTDRVTDGDDSIHALATAVDTRAGVGTAGTVSTPVPGGVNIQTSVAVTFPAGLFTAAPSVIATVGGGAPQQAACSWSAVTATGCTLWGVRLSGGAVATTIAYHAVQTV